MSWMWREYVPVSKRRDKAGKEMDKLRKKGQKVEPVRIEGRTIAKEFWGKKWCDYLETFADYDNRLPRGRTYVRNGSVCHLSIQAGQCQAIVSGSELYKVSVTIKPLPSYKWQAIKQRCTGQVGSLLELLQGKLSKNVMELVADHKEGLFPLSDDISFTCSCPDWADMCKHVAAVLYGIANRLDHKPELLFVLRGVDANELVSTQLALEAAGGVEQIAAEDLGSLFGIDIEETVVPAAPVQKTVIVQTDTDPVKKQAPKRSKGKVDFDRLTGSQLKDLRLRTGLSVAALAEQLEMTPASIYRWEKDTHILHLHAASRKALQRIFK
jgi:uncharacterized Zn finger protein